MTDTHTVYDYTNPEEVKAAQDAAIIAEQNDRFRSTWGADLTISGRIVSTASVGKMFPATQIEIMGKIMDFDCFDENNDPYGDHTFGVITVDNGGIETTIFWKIDLYDEQFAYHSEAPTDPDRTRRVLTIMQPFEY